MSTEEVKGPPNQALYPDMYPQGSPIPTAPQADQAYLQTTGPWAPPVDQGCYQGGQQPYIQAVFQNALGPLPPPTAPQQLSGTGTNAPPLATTDQAATKVVVTQKAGVLSRLWIWISSAIDSTSELEVRARKIDELQKKVIELESRASQFQELNLELLKKNGEAKKVFGGLNEEHARLRAREETASRQTQFLANEKKRLEFQLGQALQEEAIAKENLEGLKRVRDEQAQGVLEAAVASKQKSIDRLSEDLQKKTLTIADLTNRLQQREQRIAELVAISIGLTDSIKLWGEGSRQIQNGVGSITRAQERTLTYVARVVADIKGTPPNS